MSLFRTILLAFLSWSSLLLVSCSNDPSEGNSEGDGNPGKVDTSTVDLQALNDKIVDAPNNPELYFKRAKAYQKKDRLNKAIEDMKRAVELDSTSSDYFFKLGDLYFEVYDVQNARKNLKKALDLDEKNKDALLEFAELHFVLRNYKESMDYINKALREDKHLAKPYFLKGFIYKETQDTPKAVSSFQTAVEMDPEFFNAYLQLGMITSSMGRDVAVEYFNTAARLRPNDPKPLYNKGMHFQENNQPNKAESTYKELLKLDSTHVKAHHNLGYIDLIFRENFEDAISHFSRSIELAPNYFQAYYNRGLAYENLGDLEKARNDYERALEINGNYTPAAKGLNRIKGDR